ncbi:MAG: J domain-containing protein [candidate division NC10 bacterium]|nr:J domain-containing protein [candidate division NC10 bacterium]
MNPDLHRFARLLADGVKCLDGLRGVISALAGPGDEPLDPYRVLGVAPTDPPELVRAVYRAKCKVLHPDNKATGNAEAYKCLQTAYAQTQKGRQGS